MQRWTPQLLKVALYMQTSEKKRIGRVLDLSWIAITLRVPKPCPP
jgi:hypothetical protein